MSASAPLAVRVWGDLACFTRPELKVERVSYEVMTPSAARGILEAIFWKPEFTWRISRLSVLRPIRHFSVLRNEVDQVVSPRTVSTWMSSDRHETFLADEMVLRNPVPNGIGKYVAQFQRRLQKGQCYVRPCLGCREFPAFFEEADPAELPVPVSADLGQMLFDLRYEKASGRADPMFFAAELKSGILEVPASLYQEVGA